MKNLYRMRAFLKTVDHLNGVDYAYNFQRGLMGELPGVTRADCIDKFIEFYPKFTSSDGHDLCDSAIARDYLVVTNEGYYAVKAGQRLKVSPGKGRDLLTLSGFLNEYAGGIGKIHPYLAWTVSVAMLIVSIIALRAQG